MSENRMPEAAAEFLHDLRLPLQLISSCAQLIELETEDTPSLQSYTRMLLESVAEVQRLLTSRLDAWQAAAPYAPVRTDLAALVRGVCRRWQPIAVRRDVRLRLSQNVESLELDCDADKLGRALHNLLANALRYAPPGSAVRVELVTLGDYAELRVADSGPGLDAHASADGYGLGLRSVRRCAALHGGSLRVDTAPGQGCSFTLRIPLAGAAGQAG